MGQKHAMRNDLACAVIDMWVRLNSVICGNAPYNDTGVCVGNRQNRPRRADLYCEIINMKSQINALLYQYNVLVDDEIEMCNCQCAKR